MITISNLAMQFGGSVLFKQVDLQFTPGNCYGVIALEGKFSPESLSPPPAAFPSSPARACPF